MRARKLFSLLTATGAWLGVQAHGAPIAGLYNTGVNTNRALLANGAVDPHYRLIASDDPGFPGPDAVTLSPGFPVPPWIAEGPDSRWIAPRAQQGTGNAEGNYTYRATFDLTGFDPSKAAITGKWSVDNGGVDILINDVSTGTINQSGFGSFIEFTITTGFVAGTNTLDFVVNNAPATPNPTGLRVELRGTVELPSEAPSIVTQPLSQKVMTGDNVTFMVVADGTPPLSYQWRFNGTNLAGATDPTLTLNSVRLDQEGNYAVVVRNAVGTNTSSQAALTVLELIPGFFNTGVTNSGTVLDDGSIDPHYRVVTNPDSTSADAIVEDSTVFPIVDATWVANTDTSKWIGPRLETSAAAGGDYVYRLTFNLTGFDPATVVITGRWSSDNAGLDVLLNGAGTGIKNDAQFGGYTSFTITNGFLSATNTLDFKLNNAAAGYTGLRVDNLRGAAKKKTGPTVQPPAIIRQPQNQVALVSEQATFSVLADGTAPLGYQWRFNGTNVAGATQSALTLTNVSFNQEGSYTVTITNSAGSVTSSNAVLTVLEPVAGLFNTGVANDRTVLADGLLDPHYQIITNVDSASRDAFVEDSTVFPIVTGPWVANNTTSKWVGPRVETSMAAGGDYVYRLTFDLAGFDPATALITGSWSTDNLGFDIFLNGASTGIRNDAQFVSLTSFAITNGFVSGTNTLGFYLNNAAAGYTGLRVENLRGGARRPGGSTGPALSAVRSTDGSVIISWPASTDGFVLQSTDNLASPTWTTESQGIVVSGSRSTFTVRSLTSNRFYRLKK